MIDRRVRISVAFCLCILGLFVVSQSALAGRMHHVSPFLAIGPKATKLAAIPAGGPYFTCQLPSSPQVCYDPYQMRHAYQTDLLINEGFTGAGHTIVIIDAFQSPTLLSDIDGFNSTFGLPGRKTGYFQQIAPNGLTPFNPSSADEQGWTGEISLDVEWAHAIAPGAHIVLVLAKSDQDSDIINAINYAVSHKLGDIMSMSFGENESCMDPADFSNYREAFARATLQYMTLFASSADDGAAESTCDGLSWTQAVSFPAVDPLVTGVGGTTLIAAQYETSSIPGTYQSESAWNEDFSCVEADVATGGGYSVLFKQPAYQMLVNTGGSTRSVPDVAYNAAICHGVLVAWQGYFYLFGGTSAGSPQWAAFTALVNQKARHSLGFINAGLYRTAAVPLFYVQSFNDVTVGNNSVLEFDSMDNPVNVPGFNAGPAWDATTGNGSPMGVDLAFFLIHNVLPTDGPNAVFNTGLLPPVQNTPVLRMSPH